MTDENTAKALRLLERILITFRGSVGDVSIPVAHTFIACCMQEGKTVIELAELTQQNKVTISRYLLDLSDRLRNGTPGHGLLKRSQDPTNLRAVIYTLTPKGKLLQKSLIDILED